MAASKKVGGCFHKSTSTPETASTENTRKQSEIKDGDQHFGASAARPFKRVATRLKLQQLSYSVSNNGNRFFSHDVTLSLNGASFLRGEKAKCNWSFQLNLCTVIVPWIPYLYVIQTWGLRTALVIILAGIVFFGLSQGSLWSSLARPWSSCKLLALWGCIVRSPKIRG